MRLINADALKEEIEQYQIQWNRNCESDIAHWNSCETILSIINNIPTVEPTFKPIANITIDEEKMKEYVEQAKAEILAEYKIERPHGTWQVEMTGYQGQQITSITYKCSECGRRIVYVPNSLEPNETVFLDKYPFCHCGTDMRGGQNE